jgi:hypothetical protein
MSDKSFDYRVLRLMTWILGAAAALFFVISQVSIGQRDEARQFRAQFGDASLSCRVIEGGAQIAPKAAQTQSEQGVKGGGQ